MQITDDQLVLPEATKDTLKALPEFKLQHGDAGLAIFLPVAHAQQHPAHPLALRDEPPSTEDQADFFRPAGAKRPRPGDGHPRQRMQQPQSHAFRASFPGDPAGQEIHRHVVPPRQPGRQAPLAGHQVGPVQMLDINAYILAVSV
ncbi:hypothetical protein G6F68_011108 [Rhizopus microsporus]|nr:hypothetical protein G6F68_011108 [Rhizopus microsporus]